MAIVRLALENPAANTDTLAHTAVRQSLVSVIATNKSTTAATVRIWIKPDGATTVSQYAFLAYDTALPPNNSLETFRVALEVDDQLYVRSSTADVSFSVNAVHESSGNYNKVFVQETMPTATSIGDVWVSESLGYVKFWDGTAWVNAVPGSAGYAQTTEPSFPQEGQLWVDLDGVAVTEPDFPTVFYTPTAPTGLDVTNTGSIWVDSDNNVVNVWSGSSWLSTDAAAAYQSSAPSSPVEGQIWVDSDNDLMYVYDGTTWVLAAPPGSSYQSSAPTSPITGQLWVDSDDNTVNVYSGSAWIQTGQNLSSYATLASPSFTGTVSAQNITVSGLTTLSETTEILNSGTISSNIFVANASLGNAFYITTAPSANFTVNITNLPITNDRVFSFTFFVIQGSTGYIPNALQLDGSSQTIKWSGGSAPTATSGAGKVDVFNFTLIRRSSTWEALGDVSKNY